MRLRFIVPPLLALLPALVACSAAVEETGTSESNHTESEPTFAQYSWQWLDETEDEFRKIPRPPFFPADKGYLATDHPMTRRLQYWLDQLDAAVRTAHPEALRATPRPRILIANLSMTNAWGTDMVVQWNVHTRSAAGVPDAGVPMVSDNDASTQDGQASADGGAPAVAPAPSPWRDLQLLNTARISTSGEEDPFNRAHDAQKLSEFITFHNAGFAKCRLSMEGEVLVFGRDCAPDSSLRTDRADHLTYSATAKYVTITTGYLLELLDEDRIISTLAHELGHFYRSHATMPTDALNYFYRLDDANQAHKPAPDPSSIQQTLAVREKLRGDNWIVDFSDENRLMTEKNLGFYTVEQEADEMAIDLMAKVGVPGGVMIDKLLVVQKNNDDSSDSGILKWAECAALRERGWKDEAGKPVSVPIGDLTDAHHSICFRAFNISRELSAHRYVTAARPTPPGDDWSKLITRLGAELDSEPPPPPPNANDAGPGDGG